MAGHLSSRGPRLLWRRAWWLAAAGGAVRALALLLTWLRPDVEVGPVVALGAALMVAGLVGVLRDRTSRGRAVDMALEIVLAALALGFAATATLPAPGTEALAFVAAVGTPVVDLAALWLLTRVVDVSDETRTGIGGAVTGAVLLLVADAAPLLDGLAAVPPVVTEVVLGAGLVVWSVAAWRRGDRDPGPAAPVTSAGLQAGDLLAIVVPVVLGPVTAHWEATVGSGRPWVLVLGGLVLPIGVVALLVRQVRLRARREYMAQHDPLTGLPNQRLFHDRVEIELARARRDGTGFAIMFLDLDGFKDVNDSLGHDAGDDLLRGVARRLADGVRDGDTVARVGGDEFTILAPGVDDPEEARALAAKVQQQFAEPIHADLRMLFTDVSIGVVVAPTDGQSADELIKHADTAMYRAKGAGRSGVQLYTSEMNARARLRLAVEGELRRAIERGQLTVHYQPKVRAEDHVVVGHEALVRWHHPQLGLVSPAAFVPLAESKGLIGSIGRWVLGEACRQAQAWVEAGRWCGPIAVNISALELVETPLDELVREALTATGLHPRLLEIELTESALLRDIDATAESIATVRRWGTTVSLDDFGTGYSGLSYLARIPLDRLKIDRTFVETVRPGETASPVVEAVLGLARALGLEVVAEGVETAYQAEWLRQRGCDTLQGYLFGAPAPADLTVGVVPTTGNVPGVDRALLAVCTSVDLTDPADLDLALAAVGLVEGEGEAEASMRAARRLTLAAQMRAQAATTA